MFNTIQEKNCFVIMPFEGWFNSYYEKIYLPAIKEAGIIAIRADDLNRVGNIVNDIWKKTKEADIILADLTGQNPNVFYELGLAHAMSKPVIIITASIDDVPFDLRSQRVIEFDKNLPNWGNKLKEKIIVTLKEVLRSPIDDELPVFNEEPEAHQVKLSPEENEILELKNVLDSLKREEERGGRTVDIEEHFITTREESRISNLIEEGFGDDTIFEILKKDIPEALLLKSLKKLREDTTNSKLAANDIH